MEKPDNPDIGQADEAPVDEPAAEEVPCPSCGGSGRSNGGECRQCAGTGSIVEAIGGG